MRRRGIYAEVIDTSIGGYPILVKVWMGPIVWFSMHCLGDKIFLQQWLKPNAYPGMRRRRMYAEVIDTGIEDYCILV